MDVKQLELFIAAARSLSFSKAAEEQFVSQTTVSYHISLLEKELGVRLFERNGKTVSLTDAGLLYYERAEKIVRDLGQAAADAARVQEGQREELRVGYFGHSCYELLPAALEEVCRKHPGAPIHVHQGRQSELVHMLQDGRLDCMICTDYGMFPQLSGLNKVCLFADPIQLLVRADHWAAHRASVSVDELQNERLVLYVEERLWKQECAHFPIKCAELQYVDSHDDLILMVRSGYAVSMGARGAVLSGSDDLRVVPFLDYQQFDNNYICWNKCGQKEILNSMIQSMQELARKRPFYEA